MSHQGTLCRFDSLLFYLSEISFLNDFYHFHYSWFAVFCQFSTAQQGDPVTHTCIHSFFSHDHAPSQVTRHRSQWIPAGSFWVILWFPLLCKSLSVCLGLFLLFFLFCFGKKSILIRSVRNRFDLHFCSSCYSHLCRTMKSFLTYSEKILTAFALLCPNSPRCLSILKMSMVLLVLSIGLFMFQSVFLDTDFSLLNSPIPSPTLDAQTLKLLPEKPDFYGENG